MEQHGVAYDPNDRVSATLYAAYGTKWNGNSGAYSGDNFAFTQNQREEIRDLCDVAGSLAANPGTHHQTFVGTPICYGIGSYDSNSWKSSNPHSGIYIAETSRTLDALQCGYPACNQGGVAIVEQK